MSINMYLDEVQTQTQYANKLAVAYRNYAGKIDDVLQAYYNSELSGKAYDSNKEYFLSVYTPLSRGLKLVSNSLMDAHYMFPLLYESNVYTGNTEEYKLEDQIRQCKNYIYLLDSIQQGLPYMDWYLEQNIEVMERLLRTLTQRLADFRAFNHESPRVFDDVLSLIDKVEVGLTLVESGKGYDELTQSFNIRGLDLSWANEINKIADERKNKTTMREHELEKQGQVFKEGFEKKQYVSVDIYGQQKMMWLDNPPYISQEDIQFNDNYELWLNEMADLYGKEAIFGESNDIDYLSQMAWEAREGIDYYSGIKLTDTEILQRKAALLSFGTNLGIGMYWSSYSEKMIKKQDNNFVSDDVNVSNQGSDGKVVVKSTQTAETANDSFPPNYEPPYKSGTKVNIVEIEGGAQVGEYVRVYDNANSTQQGGWIMKAEDVVGLTPVEIQNKYSLPTTPTHITDVVFDSTVTLRTGTANGLFGYSGGGTQYDLMGQRIGDFINPRLIK